MADKLTKLEKLLISEVSGVDDPANEAPGWMVQKSAAKSSESEDATSIVEKIVDFAHGLVTGKEEVEMTKDELSEALTESNVALAKSIVDGVSETVAKALTPATEVAPTPAVKAKEDESTGLSADDIVKAIEEANAPLLEVVDKVLDRVESLEKNAVSKARTSLEGQEGAAGGTAPVEKKAAPTVKDAIYKALTHPNTGSASDAVAAKEA